MKHFIDTNNSEIVINVRVVPECNKEGKIIWENEEAGLAKTTLKPDSLHWFAPVTDQYGNICTYTKVYLSAEDIENIYTHIQELKNLPVKGRKQDDDLPF